MKGADVVIAGAGIGGLTAALMLASAGQRVRVFERAGRLEEAGAGLTITPNASRVLHALGMREWIHEAGCIPETGVIRSGRSGEVLAVSTRRAELEGRHGAEYFQVHRADLQLELARRLRQLDGGALVLDDAFIGLEQGRAGLRATFARSGPIAADALIGADGLGSAVRAALHGDALPAFTGYVAFRGLAPAASLPARALQPPSCLFAGPGRLFLRYLVRGGSLVTLVSIGRAESWVEEAWSVPASQEELLEALEGWHEDVRAVAAAVPEGALFKWGLFDRPPLERWSAGRVTLLGDAAHPMLPFLGQGAVMAIEDAGVLGRALAAAGEVPEALRRYQDARLPRANAVQRWSRENGLRLVSQPAGDYQPGRFATAASLGLMDYDPMTVPV